MDFKNACSNNEWVTPLKELNGINLENYFPQRRSYNSVEFIHKRYLKNSHPLEGTKEIEKTKKEMKKPKIDLTNKCDKGMQISNDKITEASKRTFQIPNNNDSVLEQTIKFAKDLAPLVIPPSEENVPVFYTIKSTRKLKKKDKKHKPQRPTYEDHEAIDKKNETKNVVETYRKVKKESFSVSHSSNNTLDDLNINQSLCCTLSEISEKKYQKKEKRETKTRNDAQRFLVSESFEALATENTTGNTNIKIHLMNEKDKKSLSDSIKIPVLNAIRDCISELNNNNNLNSEVTTVQKILKCNTQKLDNVLERLSCIEKLLDEKFAEHKNSRSKVHVVKSSTKASTLEELGDDLTEMKEDYSSEEELHQEILDRKSKNSLIMFTEDKRTESLGAGEANPVKCATSVGVRTDHTGRIPARFCWTDAGKHN